MSEPGRAIEAAAVPLLVLTLGVLVLWADSGGPRFSSTWPALLVVFGALRLIARRRRGGDAGSRRRTIDHAET